MSVINFKKLCAGKWRNLPFTEGQGVFQLRTNNVLEFFQSRNFFHIQVLFYSVWKIKMFFAENLEEKARPVNQGRLVGGLTKRPVLPS